MVDQKKKSLITRLVVPIAAAYKLINKLHYKSLLHALITLIYRLQYAQQGTRYPQQQNQTLHMRY